jgi:hypothetical protein
LAKKINIKGIALKKVGINYALIISEIKKWKGVGK